MITERVLGRGKHKHVHSPDDTGKCVKCNIVLSLEEHVMWYCGKYKVTIPVSPARITLPKAPMRGGGFLSTSDIMKMYKDFVEDEEIKKAMEDLVKQREDKLYGKSEAEIGIERVKQEQAIYNKKYAETIIPPKKYKAILIDEFSGGVNPKEKKKSKTFIPF